MDWDSVFSAILKKDTSLLESLLRELPSNWKETEGIPQDKYGNTPLYWAIKLGQEDAVPILLALGFLPQDPNRDGSPAITALLERKSEVIFQQCIHSLHTERCVLTNLPRDNRGRSMLHKWVEAQEENWCIQLLESTEESEWNSSDEEGNTPFTESIRYELVDLLNAILKRFPSSIHWTNINGSNAIHIAALYNRLSILKNLWERHPEECRSLSTATDRDGNTCIHLACENDAVESLPYLLKQGVDPLVTNAHNETAILVADREKFHHALKILKSHILGHLPKLKQTNPSEFNEKLAILKREGIFRENEFYQLEK